MSGPMLEAEQRQTEWALSEIEGHVPAPELGNRILERLRQPGCEGLGGEHAGHEEPARLEASAIDPVGRWRWASAMAVAVGLVIVAGVAWLMRTPTYEVGDQELPGSDTRRDQDPVNKNNKNQNQNQNKNKKNQAPQARKLPPPFLVQSLEDIRRLPKDARNVRAIGIGDAGLQALARVRGLERLDLTATNRTKALTDDGLRHLAGLSKLRELVLDQQRGITGIGVASLANLPILQSLSLRRMKVSKTALASLARKLSALRKLDLGFSTVSDDMLDEVVKMRGLKSLSLRGCGGLTARGLAGLESLDQLQHLDLGKLDLSRALGAEVAAVAGPNRRPKPAMPARVTGLTRPIPRRGVIDESIGYLPASLQSLSLADSWKLTDAGVAQIPKRCPKITRIDISGCIKLTDKGLASLLAGLELRSLDISLLRCTAGVLEHLLAEKTLEELQARLRWVTADVEKQLKAGLPRLRRLVTGTGVPPAAQDPETGRKSTLKRGYRGSRK